MPTVDWADDITDDDFSSNDTECAILIIKFWFHVTTLAIQLFHFVCAPTRYRTRFFSYSLVYRPIILKGVDSQSARTKLNQKMNDLNPNTHSEKKTEINCEISTRLILTYYTLKLEPGIWIPRRITNVLPQLIILWAIIMIQKPKAEIKIYY